MAHQPHDRRSRAHGHRGRRTLRRNDLRDGRIQRDRQRARPLAGPSLRARARPPRRESRRRRAPPPASRRAPPSPLLVAQTLRVGGVITLRGTVKDANGALADPAEVTVRVDSPKTGQTAYTYTAGDVTRVSIGIYER